MSGWLFDGVEVRTDERQVRRSGAVLALGARAYDLLLALIDQRGQVVSKAELIRCVWPGLVVEDNNLTVQMSALRKAIGPHAIRTVPQRGYQFAADVVQLAGRPAAAPGNLSAAATRLLGRTDALAVLAEWLRQARLITLTGAGGIGKSRLALEAAGAAAGRFAGGVWLIELASVADPAAVGHAVAGVLGIAQHPGASVADVLAVALASRQVLLVLDNCEHLVAAVAALVQTLVQRCPALTVLCTSREALAVGGEQLVAVAPLSVDAGQASPAVELFVERAQAVQAGFKAADHLQAITDICRQLDGIPLAIELAAARVRSMSPAQIHDRLDQRFALLTRGLRGAPARHQTLRQAVEWSYDLLLRAEQAVLARASVFAGGFSLAAAEQVCAGGDVPARDVLDILDSLVRKSLLVADAAADEMRFGLLDTIRQFGDVQLAESRHKAAVRRAHARWMADDADARFVQWRSPRQAEAHAWLDREMGNLRVAFRWAMDHADVDVAARIASDVGDMARHCLRDEASGWAGEIVAAARAVKHRRLCVLLNWAGSAACAAARYDEGRAYADEALALVGDAQYDPLVWAYVDLAFVAMAEGALDRAIDLLAQGAASPADALDRYCAACHLAFMAAVGRTDEARQQAASTLRSVDAAGVPCAVVVAYVGKADALSSAEPAAALAAMEHAIRVARASGCRFLDSYFTPRLAVLQARHGDPADALRGLQSLRQAWSASSDAAVVASQRGNLVVVLARMGRLDTAATLRGTIDGAMHGAALSVYLDDAVAVLRAAMADSDFALALQRGALMTPDEADQFALTSLRTALDAVVG